MSSLYCRVYGKNTQDVTYYESSLCAAKGVYCQYCEDLVNHEVLENVSEDDWSGQVFSP